jgi:hypothetical protein
MTTAESPANAARKRYQAQIDRYSAQHERCLVLDRQIALTRGVLFLFLLGGIIAAFWKSEYRAIGGFIAAGAFVALLAAAIYHLRIFRELIESFERMTMNEHLLARMNRKWNDYPFETVELPPQDLPIAKDLDYFGRASLFHFLCPIATPFGARTLRDWLLASADAAEIRARQAGVAALAPHEAFREELQFRSRMVRRGSATPERFIEWAEGESWLRRRPLLLWGLRFLSLLPATLFILTITGVLNSEVGGFATVGALVVNAIATVFLSSFAHQIFERISTQHGEIQHYQATFALLYSLPGDGEKIVAIRDATVRATGGISQQLGYIGWVIALANIRHNPLFFFMVYIPIQLMMLWDFHILDLLERWQQKHGRKVRTWFAALGEVEALECLAALAHDYADWTWPTIDEKADRITALALGHPLIADDARVANDVEVGPAGTVLLVTGSNMSGKSTLLRSLGVNIAIAQAGGPVCAKSFSMPPLDVATSMRIGDSLAEGVSFYMAELKRLKQIVDAARQQAARGRRMLYLLDEILQGTNSRERHIAVVQVLAHLIEENALGAISTHDLDLATSDPIAKRCKAVHFREQLHGDGAPNAMTFDYIMREGVATTTNALKLLELVGLGESRAS